MRGTLRMWYAEGGQSVAAEYGLGYTKQPKWQAMKGVEGYIDLSLESLGSPNSMMMRVIEKIAASPFFVIASQKFWSTGLIHQVFPEGGRFLKEGLMVEKQERYSSEMLVWGPNPFEILAFVDQIHSSHEPTAKSAVEGWELVQVFQKDQKGLKPGKVQMVLCGLGPKPGKLDFEVVTPDEVNKTPGVTFNVYHIGAAGGHHLVLMETDATDEK